MEVARCTILVAGVLAAGCGGSLLDPPLPEYYGIYLRDGRSLVSVGEGAATMLGTGHSAVAMRHVRASRDAEVILFAKEVSNQFFSTDQITLQRVAWLRSRMVRVHSAPGGEVLSTTVTSRGELVARATVPIRFRPVEGQPEMLVISSRNGLSDGLYRVFGAETGPVFSIGMEKTLTTSDEQICADEHYDTVRSRRFSWEDFGNLVAGRLRQIDGNNVYSASVLGCEHLDSYLAERRDQARNLISMGNVEEALTVGRLLLSLDSADSIGGDLYEAYGQIAREASAAGTWGDAIGAASIALEMRGGDSAMQTLLDAANLSLDAERRRAEEERAASIARRHETIAGALSTGEWYFGKEESGPGYPFRLRAWEFDRTSGSFSGEMDYYPAGDRALMTIEGGLDGATLRFWHTASLREGLSIADYEYELTLTSEESYRLTGSDRRKGRRSNSGTVWLDLRGEFSATMKPTVAAEERLAARTLEAKTPTRVVAEARGTMITGGESDLKATDIDIQWKGMFSEPVVWYGDLVGDPVTRTVRLWASDSVELVLETEDELYEIQIGNRDDVRPFLAAFREALAAWRSKYPELVRQ